MDDPVLLFLLSRVNYDSPDEYQKILDKFNKEKDQIYFGDKKYMDEIFEKDKKIREIVSISEGKLHIKHVFEWARLALGDAVIGWHIDDLYSMRLNLDSRLSFSGIYVDLKSKQGSKSHREKKRNWQCIAIMRLEPFWGFYQYMLLIFHRLLDMY